MTDIEREEVEQAFDDIQNFDNSILTPWEHDFVESVFDQWFRRGTLTAKQINKLKIIQRKVLGDEQEEDSPF